MTKKQKMSFRLSMIFIFLIMIAAIFMEAGKINPTGLKITEPFVYSYRQNEYGDNVRVEVKGKIKNNSENFYTTVKFTLKLEDDDGGSSYTLYPEITEMESGQEREILLELETPIKYTKMNTVVIFTCETEKTKSVGFVGNGAVVYDVIMAVCFFCALLVLIIYVVVECRVKVRPATKDEEFTRSALRRSIFSQNRQRQNEEKHIVGENTKETDDKKEK